MGAEAEAAGADGGSGATTRPTRADPASAQSRSKGRVRSPALPSLPEGRRGSPRPSERTKVPSSSNAMRQRRTPWAPPSH